MPRGAVVNGAGWVIDGDTIVVAKHSIRLAGIDAPEADEPWGKKATWAMVSLCRGQTIKVVFTGEVSHRRQVGFCYLPDGRDLAAELVKQGLAIDWTKHSGGHYLALEPPGTRKKLWRAVQRQAGKWPPA